MANFFALLSFTGWAIGDIFSVFSSRKIGYKSTVFVFLLFSFIIFSLFAHLFPLPDNRAMILISLVLGAVHVSGTILFFRAFETGNSSIVGTISGSFPVVSVLIAVLVFGEKISPIRSLGIVLTFTGLLTVSMKRDLLNKMKNAGIFPDRYIIYSLLCLLFWGTYFGLIRIPAEKIGWFWPSYLENILFLPLLLFGGMRKEIRVLDYRRPGWIIYPLGLVIMARIADFSYNAGILNGYTSKVAPIAGSYPVLFVVLSKIVFREKLEKTQYLGIISSLTGIVLIGIT